jgi:putative flippase GtrA
MGNSTGTKQLLKIMIKDTFKKELIYYILIGIFVVLVDFISYHFFNKIFSIDFSNSKRLSYLLGAVLSFILNKRITFKSQEKKIFEPVSFSILYFSSFVLNSFTHDVLLDYLSGNYPFIIATILSVVINYLGQKFIVFKKK